MSALRIELFGPAGVGKSTALGIAAGSRGNPPAWLTSAELPLPTEASPDSDADQALESFAQTARRILNRSALPLERRNRAAAFLERSLVAYRHSERAALNLPVVHDELLLNRGFSFLPHSPQLLRDAIRYYRAVPTPCVAILVRGPVEEVLARVVDGSIVRNVYGPPHAELVRRIVERSFRVAAVARWVLRARGVPVFDVETHPDLESTGQVLADAIAEASQRVTLQRRLLPSHAGASA